jgi:hypothetical protein
VTRVLVLGIIAAAALAGCGGSGEQWYKPGADYTVAEFRRDRAACEKDGTPDEDCLRQRGWIPLSPDLDKPAQERVHQKGRY